MKSFFAKMKTYDFWVKLSASIVLLVQIVGDKFGFRIDSMIFMDIITAIAGVLVVLGIISAPTVLREKGGNEMNSSKNLEMNGSESLEIEELLGEEDFASENTGRLEDEFVSAEEFAEACAGGCDFDEEDSLSIEDIENVEVKELQDNLPSESEKDERGNSCVEGMSIKDEEIESASSASVEDSLSAEVVSSVEDGDISDIKSVFNRVVSRIDALLSKLEEL